MLMKVWGFPNEWTCEGSQDVKLSLVPGTPRGSVWHQACTWTPPGLSDWFSILVKRQLVPEAVLGRVRIELQSQCFVGPMWQPRARKRNIFHISPEGSSTAGSCIPWESWKFTLQVQALEFSSWVPWWSFLSRSEQGGICCEHLQWGGDTLFKIST